MVRSLPTATLGDACLVRTWLHQFRVSPTVSSPRFHEALYKSSLRDVRTGIDRYKHSQAFNLYVMRSEKPHCDTGVVPPSVAAAFLTQIGVESLLMCQVHSSRISCRYSSHWSADERRSRVFSWE